MKTKPLTREDVVTFKYKDSDGRVHYVDKRLIIAVTDCGFRIHVLTFNLRHRKNVYVEHFIPFRMVTGIETRD